MRFLLIVLIILALVTPVTRAFDYELIGPPGGNFKSIEYIRDGMLLAGGFNGRLYLSCNYGNLWQDITPVKITGGMVVEQITYHSPTDHVYLIVRNLKRGLLIRSSRQDFVDGLNKPDILLPEQPIRSLALSETNPPRIFVGTDERLHYSLNGGRSWKSAPTQIKNPQIESLAIDPDHPDRLYAGSWQRPYRTDNFGQTWLPIHAGMAPDSDVFTLMFDGHEHLWAGTCGHAYRSKNKGGRWVKKRLGLKGKRIHCLAQANEKGDVFAGTDNGLHLFRSAADAWMQIVPDVVVQDISYDESGALYIATEGMGILKHVFSPPETLPVNNGLVASSPRAISGAQNNALWAGLMYQDSHSGLWHFRDEKWTKVSLDIAQSNIRSTISTENFLFAASSKGLLRFALDVYGIETGEVKVFLKDKTVKSLFLESDGVTVLAGAFDGLHQINTETGHEAVYSGLNSVNVNCIWKCVETGLLLIGSERALYCLKPGESEWGQVTLPSGVAHINRIIGTRDGKQIYLATNRGVLASYDGGQRFTRSTGNLPKGACLDVCFLDQKEGQVTKSTLFALMGDNGIYSRLVSEYNWGQVITFPFDTWSMYANRNLQQLLIGTPGNGIAVIDLNSN